MSVSLKKEIWSQSKEWIDAIGEVVKEMATGLGVATERVYSVYTKQMFYDGIMEIVSSLLFVGFLFAVLKVGLRKFKSYLDVDDEEKDDKEVFLVVSLIATILFVIITCFQINDIKIGAMMVFNPEYYTMKDLLDSVKELISETGNSE